jgi:dethiobiotin synthetase
MRAFITGTDTGVGKTFVVALLTRALRKAGLDTVALKPLCSGERDDVAILAEASGDTLTMDEINPIWLRTPAAQSILVEGAGGWLVPVTGTETLADVACRFALPVIPIVANKLGCINHALLTIESIRARGLECPGLILNSATEPDDIAKQTNRDVLSQFTNVLVEIGCGQTEISTSELRRIFPLA